MLTLIIILGMLGNILDGNLLKLGGRGMRKF